METWDFVISCDFTLRDKKKNVFYFFITNQLIINNFTKIFVSYLVTICNKFQVVFTLYDCENMIYKIFTFYDYENMIYKLFTFYDFENTT